MHGFGVSINNKNGTVYIGEYENDKKEGFGMYIKQST